jgi:hypothetical protein
MGLLFAPGLLIFGSAHYSIVSWMKIHRFNVPRSYSVLYTDWYLSLNLAYRHSIHQVMRMSSAMLAAVPLMTRCGH